MLDPVDYRICKSCDKPFDPSSPRALRKHCSYMCKATCGGTKVLQRRPGRPRRWQPLSPGERIAVQLDLEKRGWIVSSTHTEGIVVTRRGQWSITVALGSLGGTTKIEMKAQAVAQIRCNRFTYESTCNTRREWEPNPTRKDGKMMIRRKACGKCRRCTAALWLNESGRPQPLETAMPPEVEAYLIHMKQKKAEERRLAAPRKGHAPFGQTAVDNQPKTE